MCKQQAIQLATVVIIISHVFEAYAFVEFRRGYVGTQDELQTEEMKCFPIPTECKQSVVINSVLATLICGLISTATSVG